ncbi:hypothetical protein LOTGIDRAFT_138558 [Lottia gigantea]|uniref:Glycosyltransferase 2-like domain-containing protein n=1 Tax=Lottia gigantea TaxID=225164 RepID=V4AED6_LOTGI|nr:hypothetical protein LOTGIDRAFT_138558 [Lottia gigantea]ESP02354.1 hypothetical protein LOTGIDRAFT_138558 [Lottia gigantea]
MYHYIRHILTLLVLCLFIIFVGVGSGSIRLDNKPHKIIDPFKEYGTFWACILLFIRFLPVITLPLALFNFLGIVCFNTHPVKPALKASVLFGPFLCFRVVTRGMFPALVKRNVERNIEKCIKLGLTNFVFEIATDSSIGIQSSGQVREIVVPEKYQTKNGTLYKARALQYCLEEEVNILSDNDWIIHLDEETLITENSLIGIINFINDGTYSFGQGVITYANEEIVNWFTTLADSIRVGMDYGIIRFTLGALHRPLFSWKGSFVVSNVKAERDITYDFGKNGSIAEDCFFALHAWNKGYKFGWIQGEMWEKSTFTVSDFIKQRKRWVQGIIMALLHSDISLKYKIGILNIIVSWYVMPLSTLNLILIPLFNFTVSPIINCILLFVGGFMTFLFTFGAVKSFSSKRHTLLLIVLVIVIVIMIPVFTMVETIAVVWAVCSRQGGFHIVKKDIQESPIMSTV